MGNLPGRSRLFFARDGNESRVMKPEPQAEVGPRVLVRGLGALALALAPTLVAIATHPGFTTQDGPAHVFSARILNASLAVKPPFATTFQIVWQPLPNWAGHLATMLVVAVCTPEVANRVLTALTLVAFSTAILWLRWVVAGGRGIEVAAILAAILGLNVTWILGFTSFLLGATVAPITLAIWWLGRDRAGPGWAAGLAALLVLGYFCHPISLGLTVAGLGILAVSTPGSNWRVRLVYTALSGLPLVPLGLAYRVLTLSGGGLEPVWGHWSAATLKGFVSQLGWVDPLSLAAKSTSPFNIAQGFIPPALLAPVVWALLGLGMLAGLTWTRRVPGRRGWLLMAVFLIGAGVVSPDTLGVKHGHFLPQRIVLLGLVALVPWIDFGSDRFVSRAAVVALGLSLLIQSAYVWDYASTCRSRIRPFLEIMTQFQPGDRAGTLLNTIRGRFRANPLLHADGLIAATTDTVFWTNYETAQYYFPVKVRPGLDHPVATAFELVAILDEPGDAAQRANLWANLLRRHGSQIDKIIEWQDDPTLDEVIRRDYRLTAQHAHLRLWTRNPPLD